MSAKIKEFLILSLLVLCFSIIEAEIDCGGNRFYCPTYNTYLICFYDPARNVTVTVTDRVSMCPSGTLCDESIEENCDSAASIDCEGNEFLCLTANTYHACDVQPDNSSRTISSEIKYCPDGTYCDHTYGEFECDSPVLPDTSNTAAPSTTSPEVTTTIEVTTSSTPLTTTTTTTVESTPEIPTDFECVRDGRYPNPAQAGCRNYIFCKGGGPFTIEVITCNGTEIFSPDYGRCVLPSLYTCPDDSSTTSSDISTSLTTQLTTDASTGVTQEDTSSDIPPTTIDIITSSVSDTSETELPEITIPSSTPRIPSLGTVAPSLGELPGYICSAVGIFPHPTNCRRYIYCRIYGSTYQNKQYQCANELVYEPVSQKCTLDTKPCEDLEFKCVATGRFSDPVDPNKYIWCLKVYGVYTSFKYSCPIGKVYDGVNACVEPIENTPLGMFELSGVNSDPLNLYSTSRRSLSIQGGDEADEEVNEESDEIVANRIYLNSNEDASVHNRPCHYLSKSIFIL